MNQQLYTVCATASLRRGDSSVSVQGQLLAYYNGNRNDRAILFHVKCSGANKQSLLFSAVSIARRQIRQFTWVFKTIELAPMCLGFTQDRVGLNTNERKAMRVSVLGTE